jgi:ribonuclease P protein component
MLQPPNRLRRSAELKRVRQQGAGYRHPLAVLVILPNDLGISRFAFVASRRVGNAVQRNRARRLLREVVRLHMFQIEAGWDCVCIAREATPEAAYAEVETAVLHLLARSKLLRNQNVSETGRDA